MSNRLHPIIGLLGPSGSGKSTLILELLQRFPKQLTIIKSLTSRERRSEEDDLFYDLTSREDIEKRQKSGKLIQISEYAGNLYANDRDDVEVILANTFGIMAIVEQGIQNFRNAGYRVIVIKIIPRRYQESDDETRRHADEERAKTQMTADIEIVNAFEPGGKEKAVNELTAFLREQLKDA